MPKNATISQVTLFQWHTGEMVAHSSVHSFHLHNIMSLLRSEIDIKDQNQIKS